MATGRRPGHHVDGVPTPSEKRILELCAKAIAAEHSTEFHPTLQALRSALHDHLATLHDKVANLAFIVAVEDEYKAQID